jgi:hypothetical protein
MDTQDFGSSGTVIDQVGRAGKWFGLTLLITWSRWSAVGQTFGALSTVVSGLALLAFVITFAAQVRELKMQRAELILQGEALERSRIELYRTAEVGIRQLHQELLKVAIGRTAGRGLAATGTRCAGRAEPAVPVRKPDHPPSPALPAHG